MGKSKEWVKKLRETIALHKQGTEYKKIKALNVPKLKEQWLHYLHGAEKEGYQQLDPDF